MRLRGIFLALLSGYLISQPAFAGPLPDVAMLTGALKLAASEGAEARRLGWAAVTSAIERTDQKSFDEKTIAEIENEALRQKSTEALRAVLALYERSAAAMEARLPGGPGRIAWKTPLTEVALLAGVRDNVSEAVKSRLETEMKLGGAIDGIVAIYLTRHRKIAQQRFPVAAGARVSELLSDCVSAEPKDALTRLLSDVCGDELRVVEEAALAAFSVGRIVEAEADLRGKTMPPSAEEEQEEKTAGLAATTQYFAVRGEDVKKFACRAGCLTEEPVAVEAETGWSLFTVPPTSGKKRIAVALEADWDGKWQTFIPQSRELPQPPKRQQGGAPDGRAQRLLQGRGPNRETAPERFLLEIQGQLLPESFPFALHDIGRSVSSMAIEGWALPGRFARLNTADPAIEAARKAIDDWNRNRKKLPGEDQGLAFIQLPEDLLAKNAEIRTFEKKLQEWVKRDVHYGLLAFADATARTVQEGGRLVGIGKSPTVERTALVGLARLAMLSHARDLRFDGAKPPSPAAPTGERLAFLRAAVPLLAHRYATVLAPRLEQQWEALGQLEAPLARVEERLTTALGALEKVTAADAARLIEDATKAVDRKAADKKVDLPDDERVIASLTGAARDVRDTLAATRSRRRLICFVLQRLQYPGSKVFPAVLIDDKILEGCR